MAGRNAIFLDGLKLILEPAQFDEVSRHPLARNEDPGPLARELVQKGWITPFQVNLLARGQGKDLIVGPYRLLDRLGEGGMGQVYKAYHKVLSRVVALKVIRKEKLTSAVAVKRFFQEMRVVGQLSHPNIVTAFDAGSVGDTHYYAMELIDGVDLSKLVKEQGALPVADAVDYMRQAALGLQHAHERGLVHRDIKPANLLLNKNDKSVKLLDLGLARVTTPGDGPEDALTRVGSVIGTPDYLAPEQAVNSHAVDIRSDLYSLGCTFYYLLAGMPPYRATTLPEVLLKHQTEQPAPFSTYRGDVPAGIQAIIFKLMAKRPQDRYQTPAELVAALPPALKGKPGGAPAAAAPKEVSTTTPAGKRKGASGPIIAPVRRGTEKRSRGPVALVAAFAVVLIAGLAVGAVMLNSSARRTPSEVASNTETDTPQPPPPRTQPKTETKVEDTPKVDPPKVEAKDEPKVVDPPKVDPPKTDPPMKVDPPKTDPPMKVDPPKTDPPMKVDPPAKPPEPMKEKAPDPFKVVEAQKLIRKTFADEFTKTKLPELAALATKLHEEAQSTKDDLVVRYALFQLASETAARAGDFGLVLKSIDAIDQTYAIDALAIKTKVLQDSSTIQQLPPYFRALTDAVMELVEDQVEVDNYKSATQLLTIADAASRRSNSAPHLNRVQLRTKEVAEIAKAYETAKSASSKLQSSSEDPEASAAWGRFQTFFKGNWGGGLVLLAQGSDSNLKELAAKDLANPEEAEEQVKLGDAWYKLGESASGVTKKQQWTRAKHWYEMASAKLSGFTKTRVDTTMKEIEKLVPREDATAERPTTTTVPGLVSPTKLAFDRQISAGVVAMRSGSYEKAVEAFTEAGRLMPEDNKAKQYLNAAKYQMHMTRGNYSMNQRRYRDAAAEFQAALEIVPGDPRAQAGLKDAQTRDFLRKFGN